VSVAQQRLDVEAKMPEIVIVGCGVAGGALATVLARDGHEVLVLERSDVFEDRVRGEWLAPWGVAEARTLGLYDELMASGGHHVARHLTYDEVLDPDETDAGLLPLDGILQGIAGPMCLGHPTICEIYAGLATRAGATLLRGVGSVAVSPGAEPVVRYVHGDREHELSTRLVVAADGRDSTIRRALGIEKFVDEPHHLFAGMLVDGAFEWPADLQAIATAGDSSFLAFPQGAGRVRLYAAIPLEQRGRFSGAQGPRRFVESCIKDCCPPSTAFEDVRPAGPCRTFQNSDGMTERITAPGVVFVGDAAGHNDPLIGQGLSITHRDVRLVRDVVRASGTWNEAAFAPYLAERRDRMRRLRIAAAFQARLEAAFGESGRTHRRRMFERMQSDPDSAFPLMSALAGPEAVVDDIYERGAREIALASAPDWPLAPACP
jgi:2-polyprenyl-6-methoxyphenol hydroxylase-like FAD-dependent oxidoreductase